MHGLRCFSRQARAATTRAPSAFNLYVKHRYEETKTFDLKAFSVEYKVLCGPGAVSFATTVLFFSFVFVVPFTFTLLLPVPRSHPHTVCEPEGKGEVQRDGGAGEGGLHAAGEGGEKEEGRDGILSVRSGEAPAEQGGHLTRRSGSAVEGVFGAPAPSNADETSISREEPLHTYIYTYRH